MVALLLVVLALVLVAAIGTALLPDLFAALTRLEASHPGLVGMVFTFCLLLGTVALAALAAYSARMRLEVARRSRAHEAAVQLASRDPLTHLPNRQEFQARVAEAASHPAARRGLAVLFLDLDHFKEVNDVHGHAAGDLLLCEVVARLQAVLDEGAELARLGGDEFAVLLRPGTDATQACACADRILAALAVPSQSPAWSVEIGCSLGIGLAPADGGTAEALLRAADIAMFAAKQAGRNTWRRFDQAMDTRLREAAALRWDLRGAVARGEIEPYYQPLVRLADCALAGFEVLARWNHPRLGLLLPDRFIPVAEELRLTSDLTLSLLRQVCIDAQSWPASCQIAFNISPAQFKEPGLMATIVGLMRAAGLAPTRLEVEITESGLIEDMPAARLLIEQLHTLGVSVALDDFGTGSSSLYHLRELPFDKIKIDKSFVASVAVDARSAAYVQAIVGLGQTLGVPTTAEGIESMVVLQALTDLGCVYGQGFLFSQPLPASQLHRLLTTEPVRAVA